MSCVNITGLDLILSGGQSDPIRSESLSAQLFHNDRRYRKVGSYSHKLSILSTSKSPEDAGPSKSELKKRAKAAEKEKKAAEKAAKQQEMAQQKADAEIVSLATTDLNDFILFTDPF